MSSLTQFIKTGIWRIRLDEQPLLKAMVLRQLRIFLLAVRRFKKDRCLLQASALTFYTLLSVGPAAALALGIAKGFGFQRLVERLLYERFPGQEEVLKKIIEYGYNFLDSAKGGVITGIGVAFLFWSVLKVLNHIESSFNTIWRIDNPRSLNRRITNYLAFMLITPVLLIMSSSVPAFIAAYVSEVMSKLALTGTISSMVPAAFKYVPYLLILILYTLIYVLMPNTRVKVRSGVYAGIIASICFYMVQWGYIHFQIGISRYNAIYGSLAALPLLLIWLQLSWVILLGGAEISYADQNVDIYEYEPDYLQISPRYKRLLTLHVAHLLVKRFTDGNPAATAEEISHELELPFRLTSDILTDLQESGLISNTCQDEEDESAYQPASDINQWTLKFVIDALDQRGINEMPVAQTAALDNLSESLEALRTVSEQSPANIRLKDL